MRVRVNGISFAMTVRLTISVCIFGIQQLPLFIGQSPLALIVLLQVVMDGVMMLVDQEG